MSGGLADVLASDLLVAADVQDPDAAVRPVREVDELLVLHPAIAHPDFDLPRAPALHPGADSRPGLRVAILAAVLDEAVDEERVAVLVWVGEQVLKEVRLVLDHGLL